MQASKPGQPRGAAETPSHTCPPSRAAQVGPELQVWGRLWHAVTRGPLSSMLGQGPLPHRIWSWKA